VYFKISCEEFMKLFKSLLVAPATLGLLAPMAATANEVTINDFNPAEELAITNSRVDGLEAKLNNIEAGSFSETTTASFSTNMYLGYEDTAAGAGDDAVSAAYDIQIDLSTSFTGEDSLEINLDGGNAGATAIDEFDGNNTTVGNTSVDGVAVDGVTYTFPIGDKTTAFVGFDTDGSQLYTTACVYGGPGNMLDDCGNVNAAFISNEAAVGASYDFGNGLTAAFGAGTNTGNVGVFTEESRDFVGANAAYTSDNYGISLTYASIENAGLTDEDAYTALQAYYTPDGALPSISVGYEFGDLGGANANADEVASFFVGLTWDEVGPGSAGVALGHSNTNENGDELYQYEAYYEYPVNDSMTITPLIYTLDAAGGADDTTGMMVKTSFSF
jgi:hypothetical protein